MKKFIYLICLVCALLSVCACRKAKKIEINTDKINLIEGETFKIELKNDNFDLKDLVYTEYNESIIEIKNHEVKALKEGETKIKVSVENKKKVEAVYINVKVEKKIILPTEIQSEAELNLIEEATHQLVYQVLPSEAEQGVRFEVADNNIISVSEEGLVTALKVGTTTVTIISKTAEDIKKVITINVDKKIILPTEITSESEINLIEEATHQLVYQVLPSEAEQGVKFEVADKNVVSVSEEGLVIALKAGKTTIKIISLVDENIAKEIKVNVEKKIILPTSISTVSNISLEIDQTYNLTYEVLPSNAEKTVKFEIVDDSIISITNTGLITALNKGTTTLKIVSTLDANIFKEISVTVNEPDTVAPTLKLKDGSVEKLLINWGKNAELLKDVEAQDNVDGDISSQIKVVKSYDPNEYGIQEIEYEVSDKAGNKTTLKRNIEVVWNYSVQFIGHAGSYYGIMNTEEAIMYAITELKYQAVEVDIKQTKDGVFVLCHDDTFGDYTIANTTWDVLKDVEITKARSGGIPSQNGSVTGSPYTSKICSLERYLEICKQYNVKAVIELKSSNGITNTNQSRMQALMDVIEKYDMRSNVIFLGSQYNCLIWTRQNGYSDIECQYLVNSCESETSLQRCIDYDLEISINTTGTNISNSDEWLARYKENGIKISTYTYTQWVDYPTVQEWIDKGVDYVTCDWHLMSKLTLPENTGEPKVKHTVTFVDHDRTVLKTVQVEDGKTAPAPKDPTRLGYEFIGWDKPLKNITENQTITATYELINYTITYNDNLSVVTEVKWDSKEAFTTELYTDLFNWIKDNYSKVSGMSLSNGTYTFTKNGKTATFSSVDELKAIDIYDFEKTISNIMYKPVTRNSDGSTVIELDENYFLNSSKYLVKYQGMDQYLYNAVKTGYSSYDDTFTPKSDGRIQIWFRFHQWVKGTNIAAFNTLPSKYIENTDSSATAQMPTTHLTYTINDEFTLPAATGSNIFLGWYLTSDCSGEPVTEIKAGTTGNLVLYACWLKEIINSEITYILNEGTLPDDAPNTYVEGMVLELPVPVRKYYNFLGWTKEEGSTDYITKLDRNQKGVITLYAQWEERITYTISYVYEEGSLPVGKMSSVEEFLEAFWNAFYNWSGSSSSLADFKAECLASWSGGNAATYQLYSNSLSSEEKNDDYFFHATANYDTWMPVLIGFEKAVNDINATQSIWSSAWTAHKRFNEYFSGNFASYWSDDRKAMVYGELTSKVQLPSSYNVGEELELVALVPAEGRTFLGWYDQDGNKIEKITVDMKGDLVLYAKWE